MTSFAYRLLVFSVFAVFGCSVGFAQENSGENQQSEKTDDSAKRISDDQSRVADQYRRFEEQLFSTYEYHADKNASRSELLRRAFEQSKQKLTAEQLNQVVSLLDNQKLNLALDQQQQVLAELKLLLELLQSEDRGKQIDDLQKFFEEKLKEIKRTHRAQVGLRGQTEGGVDTEPLAESEKKLADRAKNLADEIGENANSNSRNQSDADGDQQTPADAKKSEPGQGSQSDKSGNKNDENNKQDKKDSQSKDGDQKSSGDEKSEGEKSDVEKSDGEKSDQQSQDSEDSDGSKGSQGSQGNQGSQGSQGSQGDSQSDPSQQQPSQQQQVQKKLQAAEQKMRDAQLKLEKAKREQSIEDMKAAEKELEDAIREIEEILRQLREEEIGRTLAMLESRFRLMLQREIKVYESTRRLNDTVPEQRATEFEIQAGRLSVEQRSIAVEAGKALMLLLEDGSSIAFPETVQEMKDDMEQVAERLSAARVGPITQGIEEDIIDTLDYLIEALVQAQQDLENQQGGQSGGQGGGEAGDAPLVDQIAELRMIRGLQVRINKRHQRYARFLENPDDPLGISDDPGMQEALQRLSDRQKQLKEITHDIYSGLNR